MALEVECEKVLPCARQGSSTSLLREANAPSHELPSPLRTRGMNEPNHGTRLREDLKLSQLGLPRAPWAKEPAQDLNSVREQLPVLVFDEELCCLLAFFLRRLLALSKSGAGPGAHLSDGRASMNLAYKGLHVADHRWYCPNAS